MTHRIRTHGRRGSTATEMLLLTCVLVVAVASAGYLFIPGFAEGVLGLGKDVEVILATGKIGPGGGRPGPSRPGGGMPGGGGFGGDFGGGYDDGGGFGDLGGLGGGYGGGSDGGSGDDGGGQADGGGNGDGGGEDDGGEVEEEDPASCPYTYDEVSGRWRDPVTGQYVSGANASAAGC